PRLAAPPARLALGSSFPRFDQLEVLLDVVPHAERHLLPAHHFFDHIRIVGVDAPVIPLREAFVGGAVNDLAAAGAGALLALDRHLAFFRRELGGVALQIGIVLVADAFAWPLALILLLLLALLALGVAFHLHARAAGFAHPGEQQLGLAGLTFAF